MERSRRTHRLVRVGPVRVGPVRVGPVRAWRAASIVVACVTAAGAAVVVPSTRAAAGTASNDDGLLVLGSLAPETGPLLALLDSLRTPVRMAVDEVNAAGGFDGEPVMLLTADEGTTVASARAGVATLLDGGADAVIGPASSDAALAILPDVRDEALVCAGSNGADRLSAAAPRRSGGRYFRTAPPDRLQGAALAELLATDGRERVAVLAGDASDPVVRTLVRSLRRRGVEVVAPVEYDADGLDRSVDEVLAAEPDAVAVIPGPDDGAALLAELRHAGAGPADLPTYGTAALAKHGLAALVDPADPSALSGLRGVAPAVAPSGIEHPFLTAFAATGIDPIFSAHVYDCTILTVLAALQAGSSDPTKMAKAFARNLRGRADCSTFVECRDLLAAGKTIHYRGASSRFERFGAFEPEEGVYQPYTFDAAGAPRDDDPSTQISVP